MAALLLVLSACGPAEELQLQAGTPAQTPAADALALAETEPDSWAAAAPASDPFTIVFLGDSLFAGFDLPPERAVPAVVQRTLRHPQGVSVEVVNAGVNGGRAITAIQRFPNAVPPETDMVLILFGANDLFTGRSTEEIAEDLRTLAGMTRDAGAEPVLVGLNAPRRGQRESDGFYADVAQSVCAPLYPFYFRAIIEPDGRNLDRARMLPDGLHPNVDGAAAIGADLAQWLEGVLRRPPMAC